MFTIQSILAKDHDWSFGGYKWKVVVTVAVDAKAWSKLKSKRHLGQLYGIDIGNAVHAFNQNIPSYNPMVDDTKKARKGLKTITLTYHFNDDDKAAVLGLNVSPGSWSTVSIYKAA